MGRFQNAVRRVRALADARVARLVELKAQDLGTTYEDRYGSLDCCGPKTDYRKEKSYPSIDIYDHPSSIDIPDEGTATIQYVVSRRSIDERDGKKKHGYTLKVKSIDTTKVNAKTRKKNGGIDVAPVTAKLLSDVRPGMIQFAGKAGAKQKEENSRARHGAVAGGIGGALAGGQLGLTKASLHKDVLHSYADTISDVQKHIERDHMGTHAHTADPKPFGRGAFDAEERAARGKVIRSARVKARFKSHGTKGALAGAAIGALAGYAESKSGKRKKEMAGLVPGMISLDARSRNDQGEYAAGDGTVTPNQIHAAYRTPPVLAPKKKGGILGALRRMRGGMSAE